MKKLGLAVSGIALALLTGCGGGGGSSSNSTPTVKASFSGAATAGDFATYSVVSDGSQLKLKYHVTGNAFGDETGEIPLYNKYKNVFFTDGDDDYYFLSGSLGMAKVKFDTANAFVVGLNLPQKPITVDELSKIVNKTYNIADLYPDNGTFSLELLDINSSDVNTLSGTWTLHKSDGNVSGTWKVNNTYLEFYDSNNSLVDNVVLKPGVSRNGIIIDKVNGGFAIGLEAKPITAADIGSSRFYYYDETDTYSCFGEVDVNGTDFNYTDTWCDDNEPDINVSGTLELNPQYDPDNNPATDNNITLYGMAKVTIDGNDCYIFYDAKDGYYIKLNTNNYELSLGSNKPLQ